MEDDDLGFCFSESSDEEEVGPKNLENSTPNAFNLLDNKLVKEDIAILSSLCSDILS